jgi:hypothetical protein
MLKGRSQQNRKGKRRKIKEGEYGWGTFYTCMNMEHWNLSEPF